MIEVIVALIVGWVMVAGLYLATFAMFAGLIWLVRRLR